MNNTIISQTPPSATPQHLPHILLPLAQIFALALPPFQNRALIFVPLIAGLAYASATNLSAYSPELRAALISQWPWYLGTISELLFAQPEKQYWPLNRPEAEAASLPFGWKKFSWAAALWANPRGINWSHQIRGVRRLAAPRTKWRFLAHQLRWFALCYLSLDLMKVYTSRHFYAEGIDVATLTVRADTWARSFYDTFHVLFQVNFELQYQYYAASMLTVLFNISKPEDWPPWLGRVEDVTTVRMYWNGFCHQIIRRVFISYSTVIVNLLGLPPKTKLTAYIQNYISFAISAFFHGVTTYIMPSTPSHSFHSRFWLYFNFFILQATAMVFEDVVISTYKRFFESASGQQQVGAKVEKLEKKTKVVGKDKAWKTLAGYVWVISWFWYSMRWSGDAMLRSKISALSPLPVSLVEPLLGWAEKQLWFQESLGPLVQIYFKPVRA